MLKQAVIDLGGNKNKQPSNPNGEVIVWYLESSWVKRTFGKFHLSSVSYLHRTAFSYEFVVIRRCRQPERMAKGYFTRNISFKTLYGGQFTLSTQLIILITLCNQTVGCNVTLLSENYISLGIEYTQINLPITEFCAITVVIA